MGFSAIAIPDIKNEMMSNSTSVIPKISATNDQLSWFGKKVIIIMSLHHLNLKLASCVNIGQMMGGLCGGYLGGRYGPRKTCQLHGLLCSIGWIVLALSPHLSSIIIARILLGFGTSLNTANCPLLVAQYR